MKRLVRRSKLVLGVLFVASTCGCLANIRGQVNSNSVMTSLREQDSTVDPRKKNQAMIVHIDPETGEIITPPTGVLPGQIARPPAAQPRLPELPETLSPVPGGGVMIQLDDRFHSPLTATIDGQGNVRLKHEPSASGSND